MVLVLSMAFALVMVFLSPYLYSTPPIGKNRYAFVGISITHFSSIIPLTWIYFCFSF